MKIEEVVAVLKEHENDSLTENSSFCKTKILEVIKNPCHDTFTRLKDYLERENPEDETVKEIVEDLDDALKAMAKPEDEPLSKPIVTQAVAIPVPCPANTGSDNEHRLITIPAGTQLESHPAANRFPMQTPAEKTALIENLKTNGQQEPIKILNGKIIDGRNRYEALIKLNLPILAEKVEIPEEKVVAYVLSMNLYQRHLTLDQLAVMSLADWEECEAEGKVRMNNGGPCGKFSIGGKTIDILAQKYMVNAKYIQMAKALKDKDEELLKKVFDGEVKLYLAYRRITRKPTQQVNKKTAKVSTDEYQLKQLIRFIPRENTEGIKELVSHSTGVFKKLLQDWLETA